MTTVRPILDETFLMAQKRRLLALKEQLLEVRRGQQSEQSLVNDQSAREAREYEEDAQKLAALELTGSVARADDERLRNVERALQKMEDGTYGLSEQSGSPIPIERLSATPEALYTLEEQTARERA